MYGVLISMQSVSVILWPIDVVAVGPCCSQMPQIITVCEGLSVETDLGAVSVMMKAPCDPIYRI